MREQAGRAEKVKRRRRPQGILLVNYLRRVNYLLHAEVRTCYISIVARVHTLFEKPSPNPLQTKYVDVVRRKLLKRTAEDGNFSSALMGTLAVDLRSQYMNSKFPTPSTLSAVTPFLTQTR